MPSTRKPEPRAAARSIATGELVRACLRGEDRAWRLFLERYGDLIYSVPLKMGVSRSAAEEIFQSSVLAIYERLGTLRDAERIVAWICEIARRQTLYALRKGSREALATDDALAEEADPRGGADAVFESLQSSQLVKEALVALAPRCRNLLTALYVDDPTPGYKEIAERLEIIVRIR